LLCPLCFCAAAAWGSAFADGSGADGVGAFREGRYEAALAAFERDAADRPGSPEAVANVGAALSRLGRHEEAEKALETALALGPSPRVEAAIRFDLGNSQLKMGKVDEAIASYVASLRLSPGDTEAKMNLEIALRMRKKQPPPPPGPNDSGGGQQGAPPPPGGGSSQASQPPSSPRLTREEAERLLDAIEQRERLGLPKPRKRPAGEISGPDW
jgi:tetratricopeptide (TPR) repeat protein